MALLLDHSELISPGPLLHSLKPDQRRDRVEIQRGWEVGVVRGVRGNRYVSSDKAEPNNDFLYLAWKTKTERQRGRWCEHERDPRVP